MKETNTLTEKRYSVKAYTGTDTFETDNMNYSELSDFCRKLKANKETFMIWDWTANEDVTYKFRNI